MYTRMKPKEASKVSLPSRGGVGWGGGGGGGWGGYRVGGGLCYFQLGLLVCALTKAVPLKRRGAVHGYLTFRNMLPP